MRTISTFSIGAFLLGFGGAASANAFMTTLHDAKAMGRGNAATATDTDPSAISYNIGGLAVAEGTNVMIGTALAFPSASYTNLSGTTYESESVTPIVPHIYVSSRINDMIAVGLGFHVPFAGDLTWPDSAPTNDITKSRVLRTYYITPSIGVNLEKHVPGLSVGAGVDLVPATLEITQFLYFGDTQGQVTLGGNAFGIGGRIGAMYKPEALPQLSLGATWRSQVTEEFSGRGDFDIAEPYRGQLPPDGDISTTTRMPQSVSVGAAFRPTADLELEANMMFVNWGKFDQARVLLPDMSETVVIQNYSNTFTFALGGEYKLPQYKAAFRAGYTYDPTPIPDTTVDASLPDADRHILCTGGSYSFGNYDVNLGLQWILPVSQETSDAMFAPIHKGTYEIQAFIAALTLGGHFGQ